MWPFKKKSTTPSAVRILPFKDGSAFFQYQCKFGETEIAINKGIVAIVLDSQKEFGTLAPVKMQNDGSQLAILKVASEDGGFVVPSTTPSSKGDRLIPGDVVIWVPMTFNAELGEKFGDSRCGWVGMIRAKVVPEIDLASSQIKLAGRFD